ncbi:Hypothetical_protein [Hexamita inflata]|uniref:Hypothetical_protein n=1 Tax=Hexamita inflata TaxID=28002 RepID=A0ABP1I8L5_9EUKA
MLLFSRATRFRCAWLGLLLETEFFRMSCLVLEVGQFFWLNSTLMAVYSTTQMPSLVIVSVSLSCNVYFNSVRELELVVDVHEHLVSRGSFEAEVLVVGVIDDVLDQLSDRLSLEGCRRLKVCIFIKLLLFIEYYALLKILSLQRIQYTKVFNQFLLNYCCLSSIMHY